MSWERRAVNFLRQTSQKATERNADELLSFSMSLLSILCGADVTMRLSFEDDYTIKIKDATPAYLDDIILNPAPVKALFGQNDNNVANWEDVNRQNDVFDGILVTCSSASIIPIVNTTGMHAIIIGWTAPQKFNTSYEDFIDIAKFRLEEMLRNAYEQKTLETVGTLQNAVLQTIPDAVIFIGNDGYSNLINEKAAAMLDLETNAPQQASTISIAMAQFMNKAANHEALNKAAMPLFTDENASLKDFKLQFVEKEILVSCLPVNQNKLKGRLWIFR
jgi:hypothetical protein